MIVKLKDILFFSYHSCVSTIAVALIILKVTIIKEYMDRESKCAYIKREVMSTKLLRRRPLIVHKVYTFS